MRKVNSSEVEELSWSSPKGTFAGFGRQISEALGRERQSTDIMLRHPFDVEILRVPPGKTPYPYHSHSAQWEFYHVISGTGSMRHEGGHERIAEGDALLFPPREPHQIINNGSEDLVVYVIADNPMGESNYYPDSNKYAVGLPERSVLRSDRLDYFDGEE
jgi:uncharacterized cupin superfamily protein